MSITSELATAVASAINSANIPALLTGQPEVTLNASFIALPRRNVNDGSTGFEVHVTPDYLSVESKDRNGLKKWQCGIIVSVLKPLSTKAVEPHRSEEIAQCEEVCEKIADYFTTNNTVDFHSAPVIKTCITKAAFKPFFADEYVNSMTTFGSYGEFTFFFYTR